MKKWILGLAGVLLLGLPVVWRLQFPNQDTFLNATPRLDASTPAMQNGLLLLGIVKTERNAFTLAFSAPSLPRVTGDFTHPYSAPRAFDVRATTSRGDKWKVGWRVDDSNSSSYNAADLPLRHAGLPDPKLLAELPLAYPSGCEWVDVEMSDQSGHRARWRFDSLQTARDIMPNPAARSNTYARNGMFLRLDGQWRHWDTTGFQDWGAELNLSGCATPNPARVWRVEPTGAQAQWASYHERIGPSTSQERMGTMTCTLPKLSGASVNTGRGLFGQQLPGYYPNATNYGVCYFDLLEYAVDARGQETLLSRTPMSLAAPFVDKGSQEKLYPKAFKTLPSKSR